MAIRVGVGVVVGSSQTSPTGPHTTSKHRHSKTKNGKIERRTIVYLTSILRLRCIPAVPYEDIAHVLLMNFYDPMVYVAWQVSTRAMVTASKKGFKRTDISDLKGWLTEYAEHLFHQAGLSHSITYSDARAASNENITAIISHSALRGYVAVDDIEGDLQANWKRATHWKAGSTPESRPRDATRAIVTPRPIGTSRPQKDAPAEADSTSTSILTSLGLPEKLDIPQKPTVNEYSP